MRNVTTLPGLLVHREFRPEQFAGVVSLISSTNQLGFAFGPTLFGVVGDVSGGYGAALGLASGLDVLAATLILLGGRRVRASVNVACASRPYKP